MNTDESISKQVATEVVATFIHELSIQPTDEQFFQMADACADWIKKEGMKKDTLIRRQAALKRAVILIHSMRLETMKDIFAQATKLYSYF